MRFLPITTVLLTVFTLPLAGQDAEVSKTEKLKDSVREWIETMREIQQEENKWERDRVLLEGQRDALETEIQDLTESVAAAKVEKEGADKQSTDEIEKRDAYVKAKDLLEAEVRTLEQGLLPQLAAFPKPLAEEPKIKELMAQVRKDAALEGEEAKLGLTKRLNNVINLLTEAEKWQQTVHLRDELHRNDSGQEFNMKVIYFGLASAYAVNETGDFALVGQPADDGWSFEVRNDLAESIQQMLKVLNGDADAQFIELPIELK